MQPTSECGYEALRGVKIRFQLHYKKPKRKQVVLRVYGNCPELKDGVDLDECDMSADFWESPHVVIKSVAVFGLLQYWFGVVDEETDKVVAVEDRHGVVGFREFYMPPAGTWSDMDNRYTRVGGFFNDMAKVEMTVCSSELPEPVEDEDPYG